MTLFAFPFAMEVEQVGKIGAKISILAEKPASGVKLKIKYLEQNGMSV